MKGTDRRVHNYTEIPIAEVRPSPAQTRQDHSVDDLVASIGSQGLLQPIMVRICRSDDKGPPYEVIHGHRRLEACRALGHLKIAADVQQDIEDAEAHAMTAAENLERRDLAPLEQAAAIGHLQASGMTVEQIADQLGWTPATVAKRACLTKLGPAWRKAIEEKKHGVDRFSAAHLALIARMPETMQDTLLQQHAESIKHHAWKGDDYVPTVGDVRHDCSELMRDLSAAPWGDKDPGPALCAECIARSDREVALFDDLAAPGGKRKAGGVRCLDGSCFEGKAKAWLDSEITRLREKHGQELHALVGFGNQPALPEDMPVIKDSWRWTAAKKTDEGAKPVLAVGGEGFGTVKYMKPVGRTEEGGRPPAVTEAEKQKRKRETLERRRAVAVIAAVRKLLSDVGADEHVKTEAILAAAAVFGADGAVVAALKRWEGLKKWLGRDIKSLAGTVLMGVARNWDEELSQQERHAAAWKAMPDLRDAQEICAFFGWDYRRMVAQVEAEIPEPKSWGGKAKATRGKR